MSDDLINLIIFLLAIPVSLILLTTLAVINCMITNWIEGKDMGEWHARNNRGV